MKSTLTILTISLITLPALAMERKESKEEEIVIHSIQKAETQGVEKLNPDAKEFLLDITSVKGDSENLFKSETFISSNKGNYVLIRKCNPEMSARDRKAYSSCLYQITNLTQPIKTFDGLANFSNNSNYIVVIKVKEKNKSNTLEIFDISSLEKPKYTFDNFSSEYLSCYKFSSDYRYFAYQSWGSYKVVNMNDGKTITIPNCHDLYFGWDVSTSNSFEQFTELPADMQKEILEFALHGSIDQANNKQLAENSIINLKKTSQNIKKICDNLLPLKQSDKEQENTQKIRNKLKAKEPSSFDPVIVVENWDSKNCGYRAHIFDLIANTEWAWDSLWLSSPEIEISKKNKVHCYGYKGGSVEWNLKEKKIQDSAMPHSQQNQPKQNSLKWLHPNGYELKLLPGNLLALLDKNVHDWDDQTPIEHYLHNTPTYVFLTDPNGMQDHDAQLLNKIYEGISKNSPVQLTEDETGIIQIWPEHLKKCIEHYLLGQSIINQIKSGQLTFEKNNLNTLENNN